ncbi:hypothetical protein WJX74_002747 [Apatococcus lobatus]|uniref:Uncharacterized protein n=1 Tax=Apatococcus lobatus TaxID=904363 RepID=A0AAW1Q949_9CHLO
MTNYQEHVRSAFVVNRSCFRLSEGACNSRVTSPNKHISAEANPAKQQPGLRTLRSFNPKLLAAIVKACGGPHKLVARMSVGLLGQETTPTGYKTAHTLEGNSAMEHSRLEELLQRAWTASHAEEQHAALNAVAQIAATSSANGINSDDAALHQMLVGMLEAAVTDVLEGVSDDVVKLSTVETSCHATDNRLTSSASRLGLAATLAWTIDGLVRASSCHAEAMLQAGGCPALIRLLSIPHPSAQDAAIFTTASLVKWNLAAVQRSFACFRGVCVLLDSIWQQHYLGLLPPRLLQQSVALICKILPSKPHTQVRETADTFGLRAQVLESRGIHLLVELCLDDSAAIYQPAVAALHHLTLTERGFMGILMQATQDARLLAAVAAASPVLSNYHQEGLERAQVELARLRDQQLSRGRPSPGPCGLSTDSQADVAGERQPSAWMVAKAATTGTKQPQTPPPLHHFSESHSPRHSIDFHRFGPLADSEGAHRTARPLPLPDYPSCTSAMHRPEFHPLEFSDGYPSLWEQNTHQFPAREGAADVQGRRHAGGNHNFDPPGPPPGPGHEIGTDGRAQHRPSSTAALPDSDAGQIDALGHATGSYSGFHVGPEAAGHGSTMSAPATLHLHGQGSVQGPAQSSQPLASNSGFHVWPEASEGLHGVSSAPVTPNPEYAGGQRYLQDLGDDSWVGQHAGDFQAQSHSMAFDYTTDGVDTSLPQHSTGQGSLQGAATGSQMEQRAGTRAAPTAPAYAYGLCGQDMANQTQESAGGQHCRDDWSDDLLRSFTDSDEFLEAVPAPSYDMSDTGRVSSTPASRQSPGYWPPDCLAVPTVSQHHGFPQAPGMAAASAQFHDTFEAPQKGRGMIEVPADFDFGDDWPEGLLGSCPDIQVMPVAAHCMDDGHHNTPQMPAARQRNGWESPGDVTELMGYGSTDAPGPVQQQLSCSQRYSPGRASRGHDSWRRSQGTSQTASHLGLSNNVGDSSSSRCAKGHQLRNQQFAPVDTLQTLTRCRGILETALQQPGTRVSKPPRTDARRQRPSHVWDTSMAHQIDSALASSMPDGTSRSRVPAADAAGDTRLHGVQKRRLEDSFQDMRSSLQLLDDSPTRGPQGIKPRFMMKPVEHDGPEVIKPRFMIRPAAAYSAQALRRSGWKSLERIQEAAMPPPSATHDGHAAMQMRAHHHSNLPAFENSGQPPLEQHRPPGASSFLPTESCQQRVDVTHQKGEAPSQRVKCKHQEESLRTGGTNASLPLRRNGLEAKPPLAQIQGLNHSASLLNGHGNQRQVGRRPTALPPRSGSPARSAVSLADDEPLPISSGYFISSQRPSSSCLLDTTTSVAEGVGLLAAEDASAIPTLSLKKCSVSSIKSAASSLKLENVTDMAKRRVSNLLRTFSCGLETI